MLFFSNTTQQHLNKGTTHFEYAKEAGLNIFSNITEAVKATPAVALQAVAGVAAFDYISGKVMTSYAMKWALPSFAGKLVSFGASAIFFHPTAMLASCVGISIGYSPDSAIKVMKNLGTAGLNAIKVVSNSIQGLVEGGLAAASFIDDICGGAEEAHDSNVSYLEPGVIG